MAVFYKLKTNKNVNNSTAYGKWYASAVVADVKTLDDVAEIIQRNASVKRSDVKAVLTELPEVLRDMLLNSCRVKIDGLGSFKVGVSSKGVDSVDNFNAMSDVKRVRVIFTPDAEIDATTGKRITTLLQGATLSDISKKASTEAVKASTATDDASADSGN